MNASLALLLQDTRRLLACQQALGLHYYPALPQVSSFAQSTFSPLVHQAPPVPVLTSPSPIPPAPISSESLHTALAACDRCASSTAPPRLGQGPQHQPRLVVIGDVYAGPEGIWGPEEDALFWRMMAAIDLDPSSVYVTNAIKCLGQDLRQAEQHCGSWLHQELAHLKPKLICTLGEVASRLVLKTQTPFIRLRGRFHSYRLAQGQNAEVMPTLHPRFLLQQPDPVIQHKIKLGVWKDLQQLQAKMRAARP